MKAPVFTFIVSVLQAISGACEKTVQAPGDTSPLTVFFSTSDACCKFNDQRIVGAAVESPDERDLAYNDTHFWVVLTAENMTNDYDFAYNYTCKTDPRVCSQCSCYEEGIHLQLQSAAKPDSSIAIADAPEGKRGLHELAWIIPVVCVLSAMVIIALLAIGQIGKRLRRPRPIADPQPQYEIVGGNLNGVVPAEPVGPPSSSEEGSERSTPTSQATSSSGGLQFPMDVSPNLSSGEHQPVANGNDGATNQVTAEVHVDPPVPTPQRGPQSQMGPATGTITGVGSAVSHTTGVNGTGSAVSHITGIGSAVSNTTGIGVGSAVSHITGVNGTGSVDSHITGVGSAVSHITGVNGAGSVLSHITGIDETASVKSTDTGVGIAPPHQPSLPLDVSVSPSVRVMGKPRASPALSIIMSSEYSTTGPGTSIGSLRNTDKTPLLDSLATDT